MFIILQILTSVKEITLVTRMPLDHMYVNAIWIYLKRTKLHRWSRQLDKLKYSWWNIRFKCFIIIKVITRLRVRPFWSDKHDKYIYGFSDIDKCQGNHYCHVNATCTNTKGSFVCECHPEFNGNGQSFTGEFNLFAIVVKTFLLEFNLVQLSLMTRKLPES